MPLAEVHLNMGYACNSNCKHCVVQIKRETLKNSDKAQMNLSTEQAKELLQKAADKKTGKIVISGGEPTEREDITELTLWILSRGISVNIQTNGTNTSVVKDILSKCVDYSSNLSFMIPLHAANHERHDYIAGKDGAFKAAARTLQLLREKNIAVEGKIVFTKLTDNLEKISDIYYDYNVKKIIIAYPHCVGFSDEMIRRTDVELCDVYDKLSFIPSKTDMYILLQGFPYCSITGLHNYIQENNVDYLNTEIIEMKYKDNYEYLWHDFRKKDKLKFKKCKACPFNENCEGIWKEYIRVFGDED